MPLILDGRKGCFEVISINRIMILEENVKLGKHLDYMAFPRLCALAEVLWLKNLNKKIKTLFST